MQGSCQGDREGTSIDEPNPPFHHFPAQLAGALSILWSVATAGAAEDCYTPNGVVTFLKQTRSCCIGRMTSVCHCATIVIASITKVLGASSHVYLGKDI